MTAATFWRAECETANYEFVAYGATKKEAIAVLRQTFEAHIKRRDGWMTWSEIMDDVYAIKIKIGEGYVH